MPTPDPSRGAAAQPRRPGRPRQTEAAREPEVRERLLDAATALAVEQGFEACGLREIAARAEVSSGMISYYFGDRSGLYDAMFERAFERISAQVTELLESDPPAGDRLDELLRIHVSALAADPWLPRLIAREVLAAQDTAFRENFQKRVANGPLSLMTRWIQEEQARGQLRGDLDPHLAAMSIAALSAFPYLMLPVLGPQLGIELDAAFAARLIEHNEKLLGHGLRAHAGKLRR